MSDQLIGVIVGAIIASLVPIANLLLEKRRWQRQAKLDYLRAERTRLEQFYKRVHSELMESAESENFSLTLSADIGVMCRADVRDRFATWISTPKVSRISGDHMALELGDNAAAHTRC